MPPTQQEIEEALIRSGMSGSPEPFKRAPAPLLDAGYVAGAPLPGEAPSALLHPDPDAPRPPASQYAPIIDAGATAADAEAMRNVQADERAGMRVVSQNAWQRREDAAHGLPIAPSPPAGAPIMARPTGAPQGYGLPGGGRGPAGPPPNRYLSALEKAFGEENSAVQAGARAEQGANAVTADSARRTANEFQDQRYGDKKIADAQNADIVMQERAIADTSRHLKDAAPDPDHWWHSQGTGDKVRFTVAAMLGGFLSGYKGGPNQAIEQMNHLVDRDIHAQQAKIDSERGHLDDQKGALAETYKRFGVSDASRARARAAMLDQVAASAQAEAALSKDPAVQARADQLSAQIKQRAAETMFNATRPRATGPAASGLPKGGLIVHLQDGRGVVARSPEVAAKISATQGMTGAITANLTQLRDLEGRATAADRLNPWSDYSVQKKQLLEDTLPQLAVARGQGAMSKDDAAHAEAAIGALSGLTQFTGDPAAAIGRAIHNISNSTDNAIRAEGGMVVQRVTGVDPATGVPTDHWIPTGEHYDAQPSGGAPAGLPQGTAAVKGGP